MWCVKFVETNNLSRVLYNLLKTFQKLSVSTKSSLEEISGNYGFLCSTDGRAILLILHLCWYFLKLDNYKIVSVVGLIHCSKPASCRKLKKLRYNYPCLLSKCLSIKKNPGKSSKKRAFWASVYCRFMENKKCCKKIESHIQSENCYRRLRITVISFSQSHTSVVRIFWVIWETWCRLKEHLNFLSCTKKRFIQKQDIYLKVVIFI